SDRAIRVRPVRRPDPARRLLGAGPPAARRPWEPSPVRTGLPGPTDAERSEAQSNRIRLLASRAPLQESTETAPRARLFPRTSIRLVLCVPLDHHVGGELECLTLAIGQRRQPQLGLGHQLLRPGAGLV